jgi:hypothetical protein
MGYLINKRLPVVVINSSVIGNTYKSGLINAGGFGAAKFVL